MLVYVIKWCASRSECKQIQVFLQCHEASSYQFYCMVGFRQKSTNHNDGFSTLPWSMQSAFKLVKKSWTENDSPFIFHHEKSQTPPPKLMMLPSGALQHLEEVTLIDDEEPAEGIRVVSDLMSNAMLWCK